MRKLIFVFAAILFISFLLAPSASAGILTVREDGEVVFNVLSEKDSIALEIPRSSYIEVKRAAEVEPRGSAKIALTKEGEKVNLQIDGNNYQRRLDVTQWKDELIEIEERPETKKVSIGIFGDKFALRQKGVTAVTGFPINIDSERAQLAVSTQTGDRLVSILPLQAVESSVRAKLISRVEGNIELVEEERELSYIIAGDKLINFFNIYKHPIPVTVRVSASTGEITGLDSPTLFKYLSFLFV